MPSLADLYLARGNQAADTVLRDAAIRSQQQQASGANWGRSLAAIGQTVAAIPEQMEAAKVNAQRRELGQLELDDAKRKKADIDALDAAFSSGATLDSITDALVKTGNGHLVASVKKSWLDADQSASAAQKARADAERAENDYFGALAASVKAQNYDPAVAGLALAHAQKKGHDVTQIVDALKADPSKLRSIVDRMIAISTEQQKLDVDRQSAATSKQNADTAATRLNAELPGITADSAMKQQVATNMQGGLTADQRADNATAAQNAQTARINANKPAAAATVTIQTPDGQQLLDKRTGVARPITDSAGNVVQAAPTADMRNKAAGRELVGKSISAIKTLGDRIITRIGPAQRAAAIKRGAEAVFGNDPEFRTYQDARMALAGNLAVAQQGSRPSDADIKAIWLPLVPDAYRDTKDSAAMKWQLINTMSNTSGADSGDVLRYDPATGKVQ